MIAVQCKNFSALQICLSGQCFRMEACGEDRYCLVAAGKYLQIVQNNDNILFECTQEEYDTIWKNYFDMETDYAKIINSIDVDDTYLTSAVEFVTWESC